MGRKSREKRERRDDPVRRAQAIGLRAEKLGRRVAPTRDAYESVARTRGERGVIEAVISRSNQRWENVRRNISALSDPVAETVHVLDPMDVVLWRLGVRFDEPPSSYYGAWPDQLRWATDSACQAQRMVMAGSLVGAAAVARTQLERWSSNRETSNGLVPDDGVSTADHYTDIWSHERPSHAAGAVWRDLSELLHGRGDPVSAARWESQLLCDPGEIALAMPSVDETQTAIQLALRQVLLCTADLAVPPLYPPGFSQAFRDLPLARPSEVVVKEASPMLWPMTLDMLQHFGPALSAAGQAYRTDVKQLASQKSPRPLSYSRRAFEALVERRSRAATTALWAFDQEREQFGDHFNPESVRYREFGYTIINEAAGLLSRWTTGAPSDAYAVGASALRAALWLWLEDDDRALVLARTVLEQTARLRTWRVKPGHAEKLEARGPKTSTRDWLEEAGWRRLSILNRSLGEFAHANPATARWSGAREALAKLHPADDAPSPAIQTARGGTLDAIAFAFGAEVMEATRGMHSELADALATVLPYASEDEAPLEIDEWLERCWQHRGESLGDPEFVVPGQTG